MGFAQDLAAASAWARTREWRGIDPYDALLSPALHGLARGLGTTAGIALTQLVRRSPVDFRPLLGIPPTQNPKGLALFLSAAARSGDRADAGVLRDLLLGARARGWEEPCWGYPFPWRGRSFYLPAGTPTAVVTAFVAEAFLDAQLVDPDPAGLAVVRGCCEFFLDRLQRTVDETGACLSYSPLDRTTVYNASLLAARVLSLASTRLREPSLVDEARPLVTYALARQEPDGSWLYGGDANQRWCDAFHTGFVLCSLHAYQRATGDSEVERALRRGASFYEASFFGPDGEAYLSPGKDYPLDVHSGAQGIVTFLELREMFPHFADRARKTGVWLTRRFLDPSGFFYYRAGRTHTVRIPYMRWSQAWGVRALAELVRCGVEP